MSAKTPPMRPLCPEHGKKWKKYKFLKGAKYDPFVKVPSVKGSTGSGHRVWSSKTGRTHHLLSGLEYKYWLILDDSDCVTDIWEQYPLDPKKTWKIASGLQIPHHGKADGLTVPTIDFVFAIKQGKKTILKARDIKPAAHAETQRVLEKLEIARLYCVGKGIEYAVITDEDIHEQLAYNLNEFLSYKKISDFNITDAEAKDTRAFLEEKMDSYDDLASLTRDCDHTLGLPLGHSLTVARHLIATRAWKVDLSQPFKPTEEGLCRRITWG